MSDPIEQPPAPEQQPPAPEAPRPAAPAEGDLDALPDWARASLAKANKEAADYRGKLREIEPLARKAQEIEEAQKTEVQRATERAQQLEQQLTQTRLDASRFQLAAKYGIGEDHLRYIVGDSDAEREEAAAGIATMLAAAKGTIAPRGERPVESLRPGATPTEQLDSEEALYRAFFPDSK